MTRLVSPQNHSGVNWFCRPDTYRQKRSAAGLVILIISGKRIKMAFAKVVSVAAFENTNRSNSERAGGTYIRFKYENTVE